ncbi:MAG TPA: polyphosphate kinase [Sphingobium sp.]|uniref:polyphosphate kinase 2 family protein n=1 Tax=Sphingobium sp. TaxID=1912891 RepID=UPI002ECFDFE5
MAIKLADYEKGTPYDGDYWGALKEVQNRLERVQTAHIIRGKRSVVMFEGWDAAGKGGVIKRMTAKLDPRYYHVWPIGTPTEVELGHHFLWRFWTRMPTTREIAVFDRSWYGRVAVERVEGFASKKEWKRGYAEINDFEAQQCESGNAIIKLFLHITQEVQDAQFIERLDNPWKRWKTGPEDYRNRAKRDAYLSAYHDMFEKTDTRHAPWIVIDGNDRKSARIATLTAIAEALEAQVSMKPPKLDPEVLKLGQDAFGYEPKSKL